MTFDRPFDRHLLTQSLRLKTDRGHEIAGEIGVGNAEHLWSFTPREPWPAADLLLLADPTLEDVAGNNFRDLLDHVADLQERETAVSELLIPMRDCSG